MSCFAGDNHTDWDICLPYVMAAYRSTHQESSGYSPNFLMFNRETGCGIDLMYDTMPVINGQPRSYDNYAEEMTDWRRTAYRLVRQHLGEAAQKNKRYYDMTVRPKKYDRGDWVYYYNPRHIRGRQQKWLRKKDGPFLVLRVLGPVNVLIQRTARARPFVAHIDKLSPYLSEPPSSWIEKVTDNRANRSPNDEPAKGYDNDGSRETKETRQQPGTEQDTEKPLYEVQEPKQKEAMTDYRSQFDTAGAIAGYIDGERNWSPRPRRLTRRPARYCD